MFKIPRRPRIVVPGLAHHITQRGNNQQNVFDCDADRGLFLDLLGGYAVKHGLRIWGYCLMSNHFHLIAVPEAEDTLARIICRLEADYARYVNLRRTTSGHLWQSRYHSIPMDDRYRWTALAYVERNPVRARMVNSPGDYPWSSAAARLGNAQAPDWLDLSEWRRHWTLQDWSLMLSDPEREHDAVKEIRDATLGGHPLGFGAADPRQLVLTGSS